MNRAQKIATFVAVGVLLGACNGIASPTPAPTPTMALAPQPTPLPGSNGVLTIVAHDSFAMSKDVQAEFEKQTGAKVQVLKAGDAGEALNKSILSKGNPLGDVFFGVDNTFFSRAIQADIFEPYAPNGWADIPAELKLDGQNRLVPIDVGYVNLNYDLNYFSTKGVSVPHTLRDLTDPIYKGKLAVENPATSSPGLAFLLATVATFGDTGAYTWREFWRDLRNNDVLVTNGWEQAYYENFSGASGSQGTRPLVVSYATSPAAEVVFSEGKLTSPPTGNIAPPKGAFRQIEFAGVLKGAKNPDLARKWMDFMVSKRFQDDIPLNMFVYPALPTAAQPDVFTKFAPAPAQPADIAPDVIAANRDKWIREWTQIVLR